MKTALLALAFASAAASCGNLDSTDGTSQGQEVGSQVISLSAPSMTWFCAANFTFTVTQFKLELIGWDNLEDVVRLAPAVNNLSNGAIIVLCDGSGGLGGGVILSWGAPKMRVQTGIYMLRVTPQVSTPVAPIPVDVANPAYNFCSIPGGAMLAGVPSPLPACGSTFGALGFVVTSVL